MIFFKELFFLKILTKLLNVTNTNTVILGNTLLFILMFMGPCIVNVFLCITNEMRRYTIFFIVVSALHVLSGFSAHLSGAQHLYMQHWVLVKHVWCDHYHDSSCTKQVSLVPDAACTGFELLMMSGKTAQNV